MQNRNNIGGYIRVIRQRLAKEGLSTAAIDNVVSFGKQSNGLRLRKISKRVRVRISELLRGPQDKCVLTLGASGKIKVFSLDGLAGLQKRSEEARAALAAKRGAKAARIVKQRAAVALEA